MDQIKAVSIALLVHVPGLLLMTGIRVTWALTLVLVLLAGIVCALIAPDRSGGFVWARYAYIPLPVSPTRAIADKPDPDEVEADLSRKKEDAHELAGV